MSLELVAGTINLAPRSPSLDGTHLNWLLARYIDSCRTRLDHKITVDGYGYHLQWVMDWWATEGPQQAWVLQADDMHRFERYLRGAVSAHTGKKLSYHTRTTILKRLREALKWAHEVGYLDRSYTQWVPTAHGSAPKRKAASLPALLKLLDIVEQGPDPIRDKTILAMLMGMGLRRAELSAINAENVVVEADHSGYVPVVGKRTKANMSGEREAAFDSATGKIIVAYLDSLPRTTGPLFVGRHGERLLGGGIYKVVKKAIAAAGLQNQIIGPHDLRRAFATHYRRTCKTSGDLLQRQLGHAHYSQTNEYTLLEIDDIRRDIVSPLALFSDYTESTENY